MDGRLYHHSFSGIFIECFGFQNAIPYFRLNRMSRSRKVLWSSGISRIDPDQLPYYVESGLDLHCFWSDLSVRIQRVNSNHSTVSNYLCSSHPSSIVLKIDFRKLFSFSTCVGVDNLSLQLLQMHFIKVTGWSSAIFHGLLSTVLALTKILVQAKHTISTQAKHTINVKDDWRLTAVNLQ